MARESLFRHTARGREPLSAPDEGGTHLHYTPTRRVGVGSITSNKMTYLEYLAIRSGMTLAEVKRLLDEGKLR